MGCWGHALMGTGEMGSCINEQWGNEVMGNCINGIWGVGVLWGDKKVHR
jgi:hypothetical protein